MTTIAAFDRPVPFDAYIDRTGSAEYETNWRAFRLATRIAGGITAICLFLFVLGVMTGDPVWSLLAVAPLAAGATFVLHQSAIVRGVRVDETGIACLPEGPRIDASEIEWVQPPDGSNPLYESFDARLTAPRYAPMLAPMMFMGQRVGISLAKRTTRRPMPS